MGNFNLQNIPSFLSTHAVGPTNVMKLKVLGWYSNFISIYIIVLLSSWITKTINKTLHLYLVSSHIACCYEKPNLQSK